MPDTLEALGVVLLAVLPGALYVWSFERVVGRWGIGLSDRVLRFTAASTVFLALFAWPLYALRAEFFHHRTIGADGALVFVNRIAEGDALPWWLFILPLLYTAVPMAVGTSVGYAVRAPSGPWRMVGLIVAGRDPAPRAWDYLFSSRPGNPVRMKLKSDGTWLGGFYGRGSYAAGYPEEPQDLYLERTFAMNQDDGSFVRDEQGSPVEYGTGLLVRWDELLFMEVF
jgi:hypothetical protein